MRKFIQEFKAFAISGNVMNLAVGVIIGAAFQGVVQSLTTNILSPLIGLVAGQNFDHLTLSIFGVTLSYGAFISAVINFIIMAFVVFCIVKLMNKLTESAKKAEAAAEKQCPYCKTEIDIAATRCPNCTSELNL